MASQFPNTLTPKMVEGIKGFNLCTFLIGLEGWRRGLSLKYYSDIHQYSDIHTQGKKLMGRNYSLELKDKIHYFNQSRGDMVSNDAVRIAQSKQKTKDYLEKGNVNILPSKEFDKTHSDEDIIKLAREIGYPVIIKPTYGSLSKGVMLNLKNDSELTDALKYVRGQLGYSNVILERYFEGADIRVYVVNNVAVAALRREPPKVTGDGESSIEKLINEKNESRKDNPYLAARPIKIDKELKDVLRKNNYKLSSILENGKTIMVKNKSTLTQGVDLYDITDTVPEHVKQLAIDTLNALPNIIHGSIDMLFDGEEAVVLEVNASANISMHMFPTEGQPRSIASFLMDFYFPETKGKSSNHTNMYFDFVDIVNTLKQNYTNYVEVKSLPQPPLYAKKYIVTGEVQNVGYRNWIRRQATKRELHGYTKNLKNGNVVVVVASHEKEKVDKFKRVCKKGSKKSKVSDVKSSDWTKEIKMGFEIKDNITKKKKEVDKKYINELLTELKETQTDLENAKKMQEELRMERDSYKDKLSSIRNSTSWRVTEPVRVIGGLLKGKTKVKN